MSDDLLPPQTPPEPAIPQFAVAEYVTSPGGERCAMREKPITGEYFRVNGLMACQESATQVQEGRPRDSHSAFVRGLLLGAGAALVGLIAYATVVIVTGWSIGYLALGVGWLVAKAIKKGSSGLGGRRYQIAAVLLTYAAISMSAIPVGIAYAIKHKGETTTTYAGRKGEPTIVFQNPPPPPAPKSQTIDHIVLALLFAGLTAPFLHPDIIGLIILFVGLRIAWQMTASEPLQLDGPYAASGAPA